MKISTLLFLLVFSVTSLFAQQDACVAEVSNDTILIGEHTTISVRFKNNVILSYPTIGTDMCKDLLQIKAIEFDTISEKPLEFIAKYTVTGFTQGNYTYKIGPFDTQNSSVSSNSITITVLYPPTDSLEVKDIKPIIRFEKTWKDTLKELLPYVISFIILLLLAYLFYRYRSKLLPKKSSEIKQEISIYQSSIQNLEELQNKQLWLQNKQKEHYTELTDIIRTYWEHILSENLFEKTSEEILQTVAQSGVFSSLDMLEFKQLFAKADLVKFAKYKPTTDDVMLHFGIAKKCIKHITTQIN